MQSAPKNLLKEYVLSQHFTSTADIMQAMKEMFRDVIEQVMEVEMDDELGRERCQRSSEPEGQAKNYRNGYSKKTVKTQLGEVEIKVPRDRQGNYEPKIIGKYDRNAEGMEEKILALYACGMSQRDIAEQIKELYDVEISLSRAGDKDQRKNHAGGHGLAESSAGKRLSLRVHGRDSLQGERGPSLYHKGGLCGTRYYDGRSKRYSRCLDRRT